jgi:hypothetical protein
MSLEREAPRPGVPRMKRRAPAPPRPAPGPVPRREGSWPPARLLLDPRAPFLLPLLLLLVTRLALWWHIPFASEDAYITFRYARNLGAGLGLIYNPGERVFGFSSPLWTVWCALGWMVTRNLELWTRGTTLLSEIVILVLLGALLRRTASNAAAWCFTFFFAVWPYFAAVSISGMENTVMLALIVVVAVLVERRSIVSGPALAALGMIRPEGLASAAVLAWGARWRDRVVALVLIAAGIGALWAYYGSPVPQSVVAKSSLYGTPGPWQGRHWWEWLVPGFLGRVPGATEGVHMFLMAVVLAPAAMAGARALWPARNGALARIILACLAVWIGYSAVGVAYFWWYLVVPLAGIGALAAVGLPHVVRGRGIYAGLALMVVSIWTIAPSLYLGRAQNEYTGFAEAGGFLRQNSRPGQKVMLEPIGMIGWRAPLVVVDEIGLVSPGVARRRLGGPGWYADVAARERPDWLVVRSGFAQDTSAFAGIGAPFRSSAERDSLFARYQIAAFVGNGIQGNQGMLVLRRVR